MYSFISNIFSDSKVDYKSHFRLYHLQKDLGIELMLNYIFYIRANVKVCGFTTYRYLKMSLTRKNLPLFFLELQVFSLNP